jgi:hypothetical protein
MIYWKPQEFQGSMANHPFKGYYLTRMYREGSEPFAVVSDLPREEAVALCSKFAPNRRVGGGEGGQAAYMEGRVETENWLRESASAVGIHIRRQNPVYFVLTKESQEHLAPNGRRIVSIPVEDVDLSCCSFTHGDSIGNRTSTSREGAHPMDRVVMTAAQMEAALKVHPADGDYIKGGRYVEVQMWTTPSLPAADASADAPKPAKPKTALVLS